MKKAIFHMWSLAFALACATSCQNGSVEHISSTRLVILQKIPMAGNKFDENFKATLELLYPHECHDTVFIQEQVFLERIDLAVPYKHEFSIPRSLMRDFFGSNNPDKKRALREELFFFGDTCFERNPDKPFLTDTLTSKADQSKAISGYLSGNRKNSLVYLVSTDTLCKDYLIGGAIKEVHNDYAKLNCRIVEDLRRKTKEELINTTVILIVLPLEINDTATIPAEQDTISLVKNQQKSRPVKSTSISAKKPQKPGPASANHGKSYGCPPDSVVSSINKHRNAIITEFRNLLHYVATTSDDADLKRKFKEDAYAEIHKIPKVSIEGIAGNDLQKFLNSGFGQSVIVTPVRDPCKVITGVRIGEW
jgi:hypothetical protein